MTREEIESLYQEVELDRRWWGELPDTGDLLDKDFPQTADIYQLMPVCARIALHITGELPRVVFQKEPEVRVASEDREEEEREDADDADGEETEEDGEEAEEQETEAAAEEETLQGTEPAGIASQEAPAAAPSGAGSDREQPEETQAQRIIIIERETAASQPAQAGLYSYDTAAGEYIIPDSDSRYLSADELAAYSKDQLRLARNEIYARHGRRFSDEALQAYFDSCSWYRGTVAPENFDVNVLNDYEKENLLTIKDVEDQLS